MMKPRDNAIHILYAMSDKKGTYAKFLGSSMFSVMENTEARLAFHIFEDGTLSEENRTKLQEIVRGHRQTLKIYNVKQQLADVWQRAAEIFTKATSSARYTEAALYRLVAPRVLPENIHRLIYLDADTIVHLDIRSLWQERLGLSGMGAVREHTILSHYHAASDQDVCDVPIYERMKSHGVNLKTCFNSGVLLMDLEALRKRGDILLPGLRFLAQYADETDFFDQDILNLFFARDLTPLPYHYNILVEWERKFGTREIVPGIYHYMGRTLGMDDHDDIDVLFYDYYRRTPWFDGKKLCYMVNLEQSILKGEFGPWMLDVQHLVKMLLERRPVLAVSKEMFLAVARAFDDIMSIHQNLDGAGNKEKSEWSEAKAREVLQKRGILCAELGSESQGISLSLPYDVETHAYLFFTGNYKQLRAVLTASGLHEYQHFMDARFLLKGKPWLDSILKLDVLFSIL